MNRMSESILRKDHRGRVTFLVESRPEIAALHIELCEYHTFYLCLHAVLEYDYLSVVGWPVARSFPWNWLSKNENVPTLMERRHAYRFMGGGKDSIVSRTLSFEALLKKKTSNEMKKRTFVGSDATLILQN
ncbi:hypothetical protein X777_08551 [Ooceraea biroi]|uniref:Uncharacterized protein n=1 Tax=Ooceraea biroi TaxID=2015173 RepID=A0A026W8U8_OOCBI|nr:hypothetical protein X777_08551 [Ooceraea biroi]